MCFIELGPKVQVGSAPLGTSWFVLLLFVHDLQVLRPCPCWGRVWGGSWTPLL